LNNTEINFINETKVAFSTYRHSCKCRNVCQNSCRHTPNTQCPVNGLLQDCVHKEMNNSSTLQNVDVQQTEVVVTKAAFTPDPVPRGAVRHVASLLPQYSTSTNNHA